MVEKTCRPLGGGACCVMSLLEQIMEAACAIARQTGRAPRQLRLHPDDARAIGKLATYQDFDAADDVDGLQIATPVGVLVVEVDERVTPGRMYLGEYEGLYAR